MTRAAVFLGLLLFTLQGCVKPIHVCPVTKEQYFAVQKERDEYREKWLGAVEDFRRESASCKQLKELFKGAQKAQESVNPVGK